MLKTSTIKKNTIKRKTGMDEMESPAGSEEEPCTRNTAARLRPT